ncbi:unnamed protein product [Calypogeia fissa]
MPSTADLVVEARAIGVGSEERGRARKVLRAGRAGRKKEGEAGRLLRRGGKRAPRISFASSVRGGGDQQGRPAAPSVLGYRCAFSEPANAYKERDWIDRVLFWPLVRLFVVCALRWGSRQCTVVGREQGRKGRKEASQWEGERAREQSIRCQR